MPYIKKKILTHFWLKETISSLEHGYIRDNPAESSSVTSVWPRHNLSFSVLYSSSLQQGMFLPASCTTVQANAWITIWPFKMDWPSLLLFFLYWFGLVWLLLLFCCCLFVFLVVFLCKDVFISTYVN